ncbi:MAG: ISAs1 family transposase [Thermodesulfobacteriota bacterium]|nr:ISAs1 family transposase [Thermodesulfobacteriota bacterium]
MEKAHGRIEGRTIWASDDLKGYVSFPYADQFFLIERKVYYMNGKESEETAYGITSLRKEEASAERLLELNRGHWEIENRVHYVRDVTFDEDRSQIRKRNGPHIMASLRNLVISVFRLLGFKYIPDAIRYFTMRLEEALQVLGI